MTLVPPAGPGIDAAAAALRAGRVVAIPTDTVYGLAACAAIPSATDRIFAVKRRPRDVELPVLVADSEQALELVTDVGPAARRLMERHWPGALTLVLPRRPGLRLDLGSDDETIGIRCPDLDLVRRLCRQVGPLATTSANRHGQPTLTTAAAVVDAFGADIALVVDGGECAGDPSTVVDATGQELKLLREGRIPWLDLIEPV